MATKRNTTSLAEHTHEAVIAREAARVATVLPPWLGWLGALVLGAALHGVLHGLWTAAAVAVCTLVVAGLVLHLTHVRKSVLAMFLGPATALLAGAWLAWVSVAGLHWRMPPTVGAWFVGGGTLALCWSAWLHIREGDDEQGMSRWFAEGARATKFPGLRMRVTGKQDAKIDSLLLHPPGVTSDEIAKEARSLESALQIAPGTITVTEHPRNARLSYAAWTDPRKLDKPELWPGASREGASIAEPIRFARFADGTLLEPSLFPPDLPGWLALIMGMSGAGKTTGTGYSMLGEIFTRRDVGVLAIDTEKGEQFLGCARPALHKLITDPGEARTVLWRLNKLRRARSDYLGSQGLQKWQPDCGLTALVLWIEEASGVFRALGDADVDKWVLPLVLAMRSAGIFPVLSIQRADFSQMPTAVRAQLQSMCLGVESTKDAQFGLSEAQQDHGCAPERWLTNHPGKLYAAVPQLPSPAHEFMEARSFYWGRDNSMFAAWAARYPASARPLDQLSESFLNPPEAPARPKAAPAKAAPATTTEETAMHDQPPPPDLDDPADAEPTDYDDATTEDGAGLYDADPDEAAEIQPWPPGEGGDWQFGQPAASEEPDRLPLTAEAARQALRAYVLRLHRAGHAEVTMEDLADLIDPHHPDCIDRQRTWLYPAVAQLVAEGLLEQHDRPRRWTFTEDAA